MTPQRLDHEKALRELLADFEQTIDTPEKLNAWVSGENL